MSCGAVSAARADPLAANAMYASRHALMINPR
jgi:hypothetical protein